MQRGLWLFEPEASFNSFEKGCGLNLEFKLRLAIWISHRALGCYEHLPTDSLYCSTKVYREVQVSVPEPTGKCS